MQHQMGVKLSPPRWWDGGSGKSPGKEGQGWEKAPFRLLVPDGTPASFPQRGQYIF